MNKPSSVNTPSSSPSSKPSTPNTAVSQTSNKIQSKVWRILSIAGVGALGSIGGSLIGLGAFGSGISGGVLGSVYQNKTKAQKNK